MQRFRGKTLAQPTTYQLLVSLNVKTSLSILSLLLLLTGTATLPSTAAAQPPAQVQRDPSKLHLASGSALLIDLNTNQELYASHADRVVPIASVTKLMTAMVVLDAKLPMDEMLTMTIANNPEMKGVYSRVRLGSQLDRRETLLITLMSSENRAANSLANAYPGGYPAFIKAMNAKARSLGMAHTRYVEPTGLSTQNVSTARDLAKLLMASRKYPMLSELSTTREKTVAFRKPNYTLGFRNTDHLVNKSNWDIKLTKTGFTNEAGHCLVLLTRMDNRPVAMVILDAFGKYTHFADASRMRQWLETGAAKPAPQWPCSTRQTGRTRDAWFPSKLKRSRWGLCRPQSYHACVLTIPPALLPPDVCSASSNCAVACRISPLMVAMLACLALTAAILAVSSIFCAINWASCFCSSANCFCSFLIISRNCLMCAGSELSLLPWAPWAWPPPFALEASV